MILAGHLQRVESLPPKQLVFELDWGKEPWEGRSPRSLTRGSCVVDNFSVLCPSREAHIASGRQVPDPHQLTLFLEGKSYGT